MGAACCRCPDTSTPGRQAAPEVACRVERAYWRARGDATHDAVVTVSAHRRWTDSAVPKFLTSTRCGVVPGRRGQRAGWRKKCVPAEPRIVEIERGIQTPCVWQLGSTLGNASQSRRNARAAVRHTRCPSRRLPSSAGARAKRAIAKVALAVVAGAAPRQADAGEKPGRALRQLHAKRS
jgi:hypothetical protein